MQTDERTELSRAVQEYFNGPPKETEALVQHADNKGKTLTAAEADKLSSNYVRSILAKPVHTVTPTEREDLRSDIARCLREDGR
jgi:hypothetical protein